MRVLVVDIGGTHVKLMHSGSPEARKFDSGPGFTPQQVVEGVKANTRDWHFDVVTLGIPSPVVRGRVTEEPWNLGKGWVDFDWGAALGKPVKILNDAAMQALGSDEGGRMLFLGLGTGVGAVLARGLGRRLGALRGFRQRACGLALLLGPGALASWTPLRALLQALRGSHRFRGGLLS